ncbi:MAG: triose-phosphate isomerase [Patescibacteria group bacterium]|nr:triose-phosphate isomerase [Patescibacteria group bacterium]MDE2015449.1 triose-phosphate isomerase [Patescibacteria group bacterium]MDE2226935.1 triose-phosphate isomerase [Patescibacteria group bacterium]
MKKLIVANWKMNLPALKPWKGFRVQKKTEIVICPPFPYFQNVKGNLPGFKLGAQDVFWEKSGAYTGEVSPAMLKSFGVGYVIIGHSERREWLNETDEMINKKVKAALGAGLKIILCVGESWVVRKRGVSAAKNFVKNQLARDLHDVKNKSGIIVAYEPVWAIGSGHSDKPSDAAEMARFIKSLFASSKSKIRLLYGGSVNDKDAASFLHYKEIDGALVGGASLKVRELKKIITQSYHN